jgi:catechol 2,3-dioxygenase-like lactoylglutathione lyase family enzyme
MTFANPACWNYIWQTQVDGVTFNIFGMPEKPTFWWPDEPIKESAKSDGHVIDHYGFSYPKIQPVHDRMKADGVEIVKGIAWNEDLQMKSFFIRAPDGVLIEIVEADPLPHASWFRHVHSGHQ